MHLNAHLEMNVGVEDLGLVPDSGWEEWVILGYRQGQLKRATLKGSAAWALHHTGEVEADSKG